jgi:integrase
MILGSIEQLADETAARKAIATLRLDLNHGDAWLKTRSTIVSELAAHYRERELEPDTIWKTHSTKVTYEGYLNKWILPRWGKYPLIRVNAGEVELWLRSLPLAKSSCAKIRNLMSVLFNHGIRYEICDRNPIQLVRQSAKRKTIPLILSATEVQRLISVLGLRERTLVLLAFGTGLRMSELFGLKWRDIDFQENEISVTRSIVFQVVGPCKTEASQKPVPLDPRLAEALEMWRQHTRYRAADDWVFASPAAHGQKPYWGQSLMRTIIRPVAAKVGITQRIGWHTFRHTYSSLLRANRTDIKVNCFVMLPSRVTVGHVYPGGDASKATSPEQCHSSSAGVDCSCWLRPSAETGVPCLCLSKQAPSNAKTLTIQRDGCWLMTRVVPFLCL